jgi:hypothetical protein
MPDLLLRPSLTPLHAWLIEAGTNDAAAETLFDGLCLPVEIGSSYTSATISRLARRKGYIEGASAESFENSSGE